MAKTPVTIFSEKEIGYLNCNPGKQVGVALYTHTSP